MTRRKTKTDHLVEDDRRSEKLTCKWETHVRLSIQKRKTKFECRFDFSSTPFIGSLWFVGILFIPLSLSFVLSWWMEFSFFNDVVATALEAKRKERAHTDSDNDEKVFFANVESLQLVEFDMDRKEPNRREICSNIVFHRRMIKWVLRGSITHARTAYSPVYHGWWEWWQFDSF